MLTIGLYQIRNEMLEYEGLARSLVQSQATYTSRSNLPEQLSQT